MPGKQGIWKYTTPPALAVLKQFGPYKDRHGNANFLWFDDVMKVTGHKVHGSSPANWEKQGWLLRDIRGRRTYEVTIGDLPERLEQQVDDFIHSHWGKRPAPEEAPPPAAEQLPLEQMLPVAEPELEPELDEEQPEPPGPTAEAIADALLAQVIDMVTSVPTQPADQERIYSLTEQNTRLRQEVSSLTETCAAQKGVIEKYAKQIRNLQTSQRRIDDEVRVKVDSVVKKQLGALMLPSGQNARR